MKMLSQVSLNILGNAVASFKSLGEVGIEGALSGSVLKQEEGVKEE